MRKMTSEEMDNVIHSVKWASICTVKPDGTPYAIEATPFHDDGKIGFMINPRGTTASNLRDNPSVLLKFTLATPDLSDWKGVSCMGKGSFSRDKEAIERGWNLLGEVMNADYSKIGERFGLSPEKSPLFLVVVENITGRCK